MDKSQETIATTVDQHTVTLTIAGPEDSEVMENLMHLYLYDFSVYTGDDPDEHGRFTDEHLPLYFTEHGRSVEGRDPWLVRVDGKLAGFVMVKNPHVPEYGTDHGMAEFFIMQKWRRHGIGRAVARAIFDRYPGKWEVRVIRENLPALGFWRRVVSEYTGGRYEEIDSRSEEWDGAVFVIEAGVGR